MCGTLTGCNSFEAAQKAHDIVAAVVAVAQADLPSLEATGVFSAAEGTSVQNYLGAVASLNDQYQSCINKVSSATLQTKSKFLACANTFAAGLADPKELAALRILNPKAQQQVQLWVTAVSIGVNSVVSAFGGQSAPPPAVTATQPTNAQLGELARRAQQISGK
jgi:hypothetical protein